MANNSNRRSPPLEPNDWIYRRIEDLERRLEQAENRSDLTVPIYDYGHLPDDPVEGQVVLITNAPDVLLPGVSGATDPPPGANGFWKTVAGVLTRVTTIDWSELVSLPSTVDFNARVGLRKNSAGSTFLRRRINLIEGTNVTITIADDSVGEEVDITINASVGGGGGTNVSTDTIWNTKGDLAVGTGSDTAVVLPAGANNKFLKADSAQTEGLIWSDVIDGGSP